MILCLLSRLGDGQTRLRLHFVGQAQLTFKAEAIAFDVDDLAVVQQAVEDGGDDDWIVKEFGPVGERLVGSDDGAGALVALRNEAEEEVAFVPGDRGVANLTLTGGTVSLTAVITSTSSTQAMTNLSNCSVHLVDDD